MSSALDTCLVRWLLFLGTGMLVLVGIILLACMVKVHDQDVTIYSVTPEGKAQVIGLRHRTYMLDYGGEGDVVLFGTTFSTGVATHAGKDGLYPAD